MPRLGLIGGTVNFKVDNYQEMTFDGKAQEYAFIELGGKEVAFINRHRGFVGDEPIHVLPHEVDYALQYQVLEALGVNKVVSLSAVGRGAHKLPGHFGIPTGFVEAPMNKRASEHMTINRPGTVIHASQEAQISYAMAEYAKQAWRTKRVEIEEFYGKNIDSKLLEPGFSVGGNAVVVDGPSFLSVPEEQMYRSAVPDLQYFMMTQTPKLTRELGMALLPLVIVSDHSTHREGPKGVTHAEVFAAASQLNPATYMLLDELFKLIPEDLPDPAHESLKEDMVVFQYNPKALIAGGHDDLEARLKERMLSLGMVTEKEYSELPFTS